MKTLLPFMGIFLVGLVTVAGLVEINEQGNDDFYAWDMAAFGNIQRLIAAGTWLA